MTKNKKSIMSLLIIFLYFILPYLISTLGGSKLINTGLSIAFCVFIVFVYRKSFIEDVKDIKNNKKKYLKNILFNVLLIFGITIVTNFLLTLILDIKQTSENDFSLRTMYESSPLTLLFLTTLYYPVVEGIVFRKTVRDVIDQKWLFIIFSSLFYFFFNVAYTSLNINNLLSSLCYFFIMLVLSNNYFKTNNLTISILIISICNFITYLIVMWGNWYMKKFHVILITVIFMFVGINNVNASNNLIKLENKDKVIFVSDDKGELSYSWLFDKEEYNLNEFDFDLGISFNYNKNIASLMKEEVDAKYISFNYHGNLPSSASVKVPINDKFQDGDRLNLYYYNEDKNKIELVSRGIKAINGFATIEITHCSDYFLTLSIVKEAEGENNNGIIIVGMIIVIVGLIGYTLMQNKK